MCFGYDWKGLGFRLIILNSGENIDRFWKEVLTNPEGISILLFDIVLRGVHNTTMPREFIVQYLDCECLRFRLSVNET